MSGEKNQIVELRSYLVTPSVQKQLEMALPRNMRPDRLIRQVLTLAQSDPKLLACTPRSILAGMMRAAELGLELNGVLGQAYLVPYWDKRQGGEVAQLQIGYRGLLQLAYRSGRVLSFPVHEVREGDSFRVDLGTDNRIQHSFDPKNQDRGEAIAYYAICFMHDGGRDFEVMSKLDVERHASKYSRAYQQAASPWQTSFDAMAKKTLIRSLVKRLPLTPECVEAAVQDEYLEAGAIQGLALTGPNPEDEPTSRTEQLSAAIAAEEEK